MGRPKRSTLLRINAPLVWVPKPAPAHGGRRLVHSLLGALGVIVFSAVTLV